MSERKDYLKNVDKLEDLCKENELSGRFFASEYPLRMTVKPYAGVGSQMSLLENMEHRGIAPNACVTFSYIEGDVKIEVVDKFTIKDSLLTGFTKVFKNLCTSWFALLYSQIHAEGHVYKDDLDVIDNAVRQD